MIFYSARCNLFLYFWQTPWGITNTQSQFIIFFTFLLRTKKQFTIHKEQKNADTLFAKEKDLKKAEQQHNLYEKKAIVSLE